jgi:hypothetical protein
VASAASSLGGFNNAFPSIKAPIGRFAASAADGKLFLFKRLCQPFRRQAL